MKILVTGGAGFIGSAVVRRAMAEGFSVINVDKLTYAANLANIADVSDAPGYTFIQADICDGDAMAAAFSEHEPDAVLHLAAESHVDRSIEGPLAFVQTNVVGSCVLLEAARQHWAALPEGRRDAFRYIHISTDEVFGALGATGKFIETTPYAPNSPYSASKAGSDHLARAWRETYGLPTIITNCSNNYGPYHFPEKLIPLTILNALQGRTIPVYGAGENVRDWLFVEDHAQALLAVLRDGAPGATYNIGGDAEARNIDIVRHICVLMDEFRPGCAPHENLISFVTDRPGHDFRYAIDAGKIREELGWRPSVDLKSGLRRTVEWYLAREDWWAPLLSASDPRARRGLSLSIAER